MTWRQSPLAQTTAQLNTIRAALTRCKASVDLLRTKLENYLVAHMRPPLSRSICCADRLFCVFVDNKISNMNN